jgi:putative FmdB family regulatory protein
VQQPPLRRKWALQARLATRISPAGARSARLQSATLVEEAMPIYAYRCAECGHELEVLQKVSDAPRTECPSCHRPALVKQVTAAGFQLKGSGWYVTDFRDSKKTEAKDKPAEPAKPAEAAKPAEGAAPAPSPAATVAPAPSPAPAPAASPPPAASDK